MPSIEKVKEIAVKARLDISESKAKEMAIEMIEISKWMEKLNDIETDDIEPLKDLSKELNN